jgi:hypothetical protein
MGLVLASPAQQHPLMETVIDDPANYKQTIICAAMPIIDKIDAEL